MVFEVKSPILGFEDVKKMRLEKIDDLFMKLSNDEDSSPIFTLINPFALRPYDFEIPSALELLLEIKSEEDVLVGNIMVLQTPIEQSTINFLAPVIFNVKNKTMAQVVLDSTKYPQYGLTESIDSYYKDQAPQS
ncbi:flagellar assembly protein FliW [Helicobacter kayseriensis]|uniref:flagellar assembly protein FliW n=1 Tax=Helicobacter kayseriensis TaxID=2905877 RepID=UPI001E62141F|nr:flagellar assembly protein FliW [Helicobacter kayseriensis]MCE3047438.1 flagellar assembly protein FliW [Helicobacter kayseriensis]MCE3048829.1 flagellar assembly protein FliW [Helicobacter kayseriensis]